MEDTTDSSHFDQVYLGDYVHHPLTAGADVLVLEQLRPDLIIASLKSKDALVNRINEYCKLTNKWFDLLLDITRPRSIVSSYILPADG
jgi:hypothetical protein